MSDYGRSIDQALKVLLFFGVLLLIAFGVGLFFLGRCSAKYNLRSPVEIQSPITEKKEKP